MIQGTQLLCSVDLKGGEVVPVLEGTAAATGLGRLRRWRPRRPHCGHSAQAGSGFPCQPFKRTESSVSYQDAVTVPAFPRMTPWGLEGTREVTSLDFLSGTSSCPFARQPPHLSVWLSIFRGRRLITDEALWLCGSPYSLFFYFLGSLQRPARGGRGARVVVGLDPSGSFTPRL